MDSNINKIQAETPLNIYQKLVEIRKSVTYISYDGKGYNFPYATEQAVLGRIRGKMDELGVILETEMLSMTSNVIETISKGEHEMVKCKGIQVHFQFTWVNADNPSERITKNLFIRSANEDEKAIGGLMTYAHRYFLYKNLSIPTDKDDPDAFEKKVENKVEIAECINKEQVEILKGLIGTDNKLRSFILDNAAIRQPKKPTQYSEIEAKLFTGIQDYVSKLKGGVANV